MGFTLYGRGGGGLVSIFSLFEKEGGGGVGFHSRNLASQLRGSKEEEEEEHPKKCYRL